MNDVHGASREDAEANEWHEGSGTSGNTADVSGAKWFQQSDGSFGPEATAKV